MAKKRILGLDLGTNSIGWALTQLDFDKKEGEINGLGTRIIPMSQGVLGKFDSGVSISQTAERTEYRGTRRLFQRDNLRRERLHRVLNILGFLPEHYSTEIDFEHKLGQFKKEVKINYRELEDKNEKHEFLFASSFYEMVDEFKANGQDLKMPYDWTLYYLRKKALSRIISKEELAWIILNFNQKRGYYQLRGDELDQKGDKDEKYYALEVAEIKATEDENAKGKWYEVILDNGWVYRRQSKESLDSWIGTTREFIVTTSLNKDGSPKRSFRSPKEDDWGLVKKKTEQEIVQSGKHICEFIYDALLRDPKQKIRGKLIKTIERKYYRKELEAILEKQNELQPELFSNNKYLECIQELYPNNIAHRNNISTKNFKYLFVEDIIFYQRPLKSKKSTIGGCQFEKRRFLKNKIDPQTKKEIEIWVDEPIKAISKSNPLYQEFRLWQFISNLRLFKIEDENTNPIEEDLSSEFLGTEEQRTALYEYLSEKKEIEQKHILDFLVLKKLIAKKEKTKYNWNYPVEKKYPSCETRAGFFTRLSKVESVNAADLLNTKNEQHLWHIIYSIKEIGQFESALKKFAQKHELDEASFIKGFIKHPPFKNEYGAFSEKAIKKILPLIRTGKYWNQDNFHPETIVRIDKIITGEYDEKIRNRVREKAIQLTDTSQFRGLPLWLASYIVYDRHSESGDVQHWKTPNDIDTFLTTFKQHSLRNPIVEQVITETLRTVRDIWNHYGNGKEGFFNEIHVEHKIIKILSFKNFFS